PVVPRARRERGGFRFAATEARARGEKENPWLLLRGRRAHGAVPVFGEANTVTWVLKQSLGAELTVPDDHGKPVRLRIVGLLEDSVFQSELIMAEANFLDLYPRQEGYQV